MQVLVLLEIAFDTLLVITQTREKDKLVDRIVGQLHQPILDSLQHIPETTLMHNRCELNMKVDTLANNCK